MKETISLLIVFVLYSFTCNAQDNEKVYQTVSAYANTANALNIGVSFEIGSIGFGKKKNYFVAWANNLTVTNKNLNLDTALNTIKGYGFQFDSGYKVYLAPDKNYGIYFEYFLFNGGKYYFDETVYYTDGTEKKFKGTYSYASFLNPGLGYKIEITKKFNIDFDAGIFWRGMFEKPNGDVDENMFREFMLRFGFKAGWYLN